MPVFVQATPFKFGLHARLSAAEEALSNRNKPT
jgi:hypothetical protein